MTINDQIKAVKDYKVLQLNRFDEVMHSSYWQQGRRAATKLRHERLHKLVSEYADIGIVGQSVDLYDMALKVGKLMIHTRKRFIKNL